MLFCAFCGAVLVVACTPPDLDSRKNETNDEWRARNEVAYEPISLRPFDDAISHARKEYKDHVPPYPLYDESQIVGIAENMLWLQNPDGGWKKNYDWARKYVRNELTGQHKSLQRVPPLGYELKTNGQQSTLDNRNVYAQITYLAQVYRQVPDPRYKAAAARAFDWILGAQHPVSGGWTGADVYGVTYNDDVMSGTMATLRAIADGDPLYAFLGRKARKRARAAYDRAIQCVINTQIRIPQADGTELLTAWCQQHDHETLQPMWARDFEPPSVTTSESVELVLMLMEDPKPSDALKRSIAAACDWLLRDDIVIRGKKIVRERREGEVSSAGQYTDYEQVMVDDPAAPDLWARMYDVQTMRPVWCDRGRKICAEFNDMSKERRNGYAYTGTWVKNIRGPYSAWKARFMP